MKRARLLSLVVLGLLFLNPAMASAQGEGVIQGEISNGSAGGGSTGSLEVVLYTFRGSDEGEQLTTTTDAQGQFRFEGLETGSDWSYLIRVTYEGVTYSTGMLSFEAGTSELVTEVLVYETTTSDEGISVERAHVFVEVSGASLSVTELYVFANLTDRTYVGGQEIQGRRWTSRFLLPQGSYDLAPDDGSLGRRFLSIEGGLVDTEPHWPGSTSVMFSYALDCQTGDCNLGRAVTHPISNLNVLISDAGVQVESKRLTFDGKREAQDRSFLNYVGRNLMPGEDLDLHVRLSRAVSAPVASQGGNLQALPWIILGGVVVTLVLVYPFWRQRVQAAARKEK